METNVLRKLQLVELDILKKLIKICEEHKLRYYLCGGTLLGAVRHKGFIPWDDDIDIAMPREDYNRFYEIYKEKYHNCDERFFIDPAEIDIFPYIKILDKNIKIAVKNTLKKGYTYAWIDIFPIDGLPSNKILKSFHVRKFFLKRGLYKFASFEDFVNQKRTDRPFYEKIIITICNKFKIHKMFNNKKKYLFAANKVLQKYNMYKTSECCILWGAYGFKDIWPTNWFGEGVPIEFEGIMANAPNDYNAYLQQLYGDYMTLPPEDKRQRHDIEIISR